MVQNQSLGRRAFTLFNYIFMILICSLCILPFINLLAISFSSSSSVAAGKVSFWPVDFTLASYQFTVRGGHFFTALLVSLKRVVIGVAINMVMMISVAYPLSKSKKNLLGRNIYMGYFVVTMLISGGLIPFYLTVLQVGLNNTIWALIIPTALPVSNMIILMNFIRGLPGEIEEAALVDGAGYLTILVRVLLPLLTPALATLGLFCIVGHWNEWFNGMIFINDPKDFPLQTYLQKMLMSAEQIIQKYRNDPAQLVEMMQVSERTGRASQLFLGMLPVLCIYPFLQKHFTSGLVLGSVKG